jgi:hypothetical protein
MDRSGERSSSSSKGMARRLFSNMNTNGAMIALPRIEMAAVLKK